MIVYLNGNYLDARQAAVSLFDAGYLHGDGLFETIRLYRGRAHDLDGHLDRLQRQIDLLGYGWRAQPAAVLEILTELAARNELADRDSRARLTVSRGGEPGRLLAIEHSRSATPTVSVILTELPAELGRWQREGIAAVVMKPEFARGNFPQLKSLNYLSSLLALRFARAAQAQEALLVNEAGLVLEGATSNVFLVRSGRLYTPPLRLGLLAGRTRAWVLATAAALTIDCLEEAWGAGGFATADEVFVSGSVREILPVVKIDGQLIADGRPGPVTCALQKRYRHDVEAALART
jgi:branched-chain amino acid aminotransferase